MKGKNIIYIAIAAVIMLAWSKISSNLFTGNQKDVADKEAQDKATNNANTALANEGLNITLSIKRIGEIAQSIYNCFGVFNDDEVELMTQMSYIRTKDDLRAVNIYFTSLYDADLVLYVNNRLSQDERIKFNNYINSLV